MADRRPASTLNPEPLLSLREDRKKEAKNAPADLTLYEFGHPNCKYAENGIVKANVYKYVAKRDEEGKLKGCGYFPTRRMSII